MDFCAVKEFNAEAECTKQKGTTEAVPETS